MRMEEFRHLERLRVRWAEVDMQRIVFNGHCLMYFDTALSGYWRSLALPYHQTLSDLGGDLYVRKATVEHHASARPDDLCEVGMRMSRVGRSSLVFEAGLFRDGVRLVSGELVYVFADPATQSSRPVPRELREVMEAFERGEPTVSEARGDWPSLGTQAEPLRRTVLVQECGIDAPLGCDADDSRAHHVLLRNRLGAAVATGRLLPLGQGRAQIGRLAVTKVLRESGLGRRVVLSLLEIAREQGLREVVLHAPAAAQRFHQRMGFAVRGVPFQAAGLAHVEMALSL